MEAAAADAAAAAAATSGGATDSSSGGIVTTADSGSTRGVCTHPGHDREEDSIEYCRGREERKRERKQAREREREATKRERKLEERRTGCGELRCKEGGSGVCNLRASVEEQPQGVAALCLSTCLPEMHVRHS